MNDNLFRTRRVFVVTCLLKTGERVWWQWVWQHTDERWEYYLGLLPEISYTRIEAAHARRKQTDSSWHASHDHLGGKKDEA